VLLYGADNDVADWVSVKLFGVPAQFDLSVAIGITDQDKLIAGVVYNNMHVTPEGRPYTIDMSIASVDKRWCNRHNLKALFGYPFIELALKRVQTHCSANEGKIMKFNERLGFKQEGIHRQGWPMGGDSVSFGMIKSECEWL